MLSYRTLANRLCPLFKLSWFKLVYFLLIGVGFLTRKVALEANPINIIINNGKNWTLKMVSSVKTTHINFTEGVEFDDGKFILQFFIFKNLKIN